MQTSLRSWNTPVQFDGNEKARAKRYETLNGASFVRFNRNKLIKHEKCQFEREHELSE